VLNTETKGCYAPGGNASALGLTGHVDQMGEVRADEEMQHVMHGTPLQKQGVLLEHLNI
jgi:hypothetical protein